MVRVHACWLNSPFPGITLGVLVRQGLPHYLSFPPILFVWIYSSSLELFILLSTTGSDDPITSLTWDARRKVRRMHVKDPVNFTTAKDLLTSGNPCRERPRGVHRSRPLACPFNLPVSWHSEPTRSEHSTFSVNQMANISYCFLTSFLPPKGQTACHRCTTQKVLLNLWRSASLMKKNSTLHSLTFKLMGKFPLEWVALQVAQTCLWITSQWLPRFSYRRWPCKSLQSL